MKTTLTMSTISVCCCIIASVSAQGDLANQDRAVFMDDTDEVARQLATKAADQGMGVPTIKKALKTTTTRFNPPSSPLEFQQSWHHKPVLQGLTGQCWAFGAVSFLESEIQRQLKREIKLSEMYTVYWEFVEKARRFVARKGDSEFGRGSEPNAAIRIWKQYGLVPAAAYSGLSSGRQFYDDRRMMSEMRTYLASVKDRQDWNEDRAVATIKAIMDRHLGPPPTHVEVDGQTVTPQQYLQRMTGLDLDNYTCVISLMQMPYHQRCEYPVPDNWWHSTDYYNLPLDEFLKIIREAARIGQSLCLAVDNSEPGFLPRQDIAVVPSFDIPSAYIDDSARQCRFSNESTTDDHVVHMVGFHESNMDRWYLVKDSDTKPRNGHHQGYMFYHEDYLKLKALVILLPRDFAEKVLGRKLQ